MTACSRLGSESLTMTDLFIIVSMKGKVPADHGIEHHTQAPDIHRRPVILLAPHNLGGGVAGAAAVHLHTHQQLGCGCVRRAEAEPGACAPAEYQPSSGCSRQAVAGAQSMVRHQNFCRAMAVHPWKFNWQLNGGCSGGQRQEQVVYFSVGSLRPVCHPHPPNPT